MAKPPHHGMIEGHFTWFSGWSNYPQATGTRPINWKIVFAEGIEVFEARWREIGQVFLLHGIALRAQLVQRRLHIHRIPDDHGIGDHVETHGLIGPKPTLVSSAA